jgi:hypothetical protein
MPLGTRSVYAAWESLPKIERRRSNGAQEAYNGPPEPVKGSRDAPSHVRKWAAFYRWSERAALYDEYILNTTKEKREEALISDATSAARLRSLLFTKLSEAAERATSKELPELIRALDKLVDLGPKLETELRRKKLLAEIILDNETGEEIEEEEEDERLSDIAAEERLIRKGYTVNRGSTS